MKNTEFLTQSSNLLRRLARQRFDVASLYRLSQRLRLAAALPKFEPDESLIKLCYDFLGTTARALPGHFSAIIPVGTVAAQINLQAPVLRNRVEELSTMLQEGAIQPDKEVDESLCRLYTNLDTVVSDSYQRFVTEAPKSMSLLDLFTPTVTSMSPEIVNCVNSLTLANTDVLPSFIETVVYAQLYLYRYSILSE